MCVPHLGTAGILPAISAQPPLFLAYEGANAPQRAYLLKFVIWSKLNKFERRFSQDSAASETFVLNTSYALSGRGEFS